MPVGLVAIGLLLALATSGRAQASGTLRAGARVIESQAGQAVLAAARTVGAGPIPGTAQVGLATISVREAPSPPTPPPRPTPPPDERPVVPTRVVSIQFLRN